MALVEASKGEYNVLIGIFNLWNRVRIRCADYIHVLMLDSLCKGTMLCDLVALIGNIDIVFGSVDR
jgi:NADH:ubiquinone oxidoreductase subunit D